MLSVYNFFFLHYFCLNKLTTGTHTNFSMKLLKESSPINPTSRCCKSTKEKIIYQTIEKSLNYVLAHTSSLIFKLLI